MGDLAMPRRVRTNGHTGICGKPKIKCGVCPNQAFIPVSDEVIKRHLRGYVSSSNRRDFVMGAYPLLKDDTCWFLAADFDGEHWATDALAYVQTCNSRNVPAALERSRSGQGGHVWIFFSEPIAAREARQLGAALMTETMERRPEIGFASYDRFFPNQDESKLFIQQNGISVKVEANYVIRGTVSPAQHVALRPRASDALMADGRAGRQKLRLRRHLRREV